MLSWLDTRTPIHCTTICKQWTVSVWEMASDSGENDNYLECNCTGDETSSRVLTAITISSSFLSIFGSGLIILTFMMWRDVRRSLARQILLFLAIADLLGAAGYFLGGILQDILKLENQLDTLCKVGSFLTTYFPVVSFFWTTYLAIYFAIALVLKRPNWTSKLMIPFHLTAWLIPLAICIGFFAKEWLGPNLSNGPCSGLNHSSSQDAAGWCFVSSKIFEGLPHTNISSFDMNLRIYFLVEAASGKMWELLSYFIVITCYVLIVIFNRCRWCKVDSILFSCYIFFSNCFLSFSVIFNLIRCLLTAHW